MPHGGRVQQTISKVEQWKQGGAGMCLAVLDSQNIVLSNTAFCQNWEGVSLSIPLRTQLPWQHCLSWVDLIHTNKDFLERFDFSKNSLFFFFFFHHIESKFRSSRIWLDKSGGWLETLCLPFPHGGEAGSQFISSSLTINSGHCLRKVQQSEWVCAWAWNGPRHQIVCYIEPSYKTISEQVNTI